MRSLFPAVLLSAGCLLPDYQGIGGSNTGGGGAGSASTTDATSAGAGGNGGAGGSGGGGAPAHCPMDRFWSPLGATGSNTVVEQAAISTTNGHTIVAGHFLGGFTFGPTVDVSAQLDDSIFVGSLDPSGTGVWAHAFESIEALTLQDLLVTPNGEVIVVLTCAGSIGLDGVNGSACEALDSFVYVFDAEGALAWKTTVGGDGNQVLTSIDLDGDGSVLVGGYSDGEIPDGAATAMVTDPTPFVGVATSAGLGPTRYWPVALDAAADVRDILQRSDGLYLTGHYRGVFPEFDLMVPPAEAGNAKIYLVKIDPGGSIAFGRGYGSANREDFPTRLVDVGAAGVLVAGVSIVTDPDDTQPFSFGGQSFIPHPDNVETFIGRVETSSGDGTWIAHRPLISTDPVGHRVLSSESVRGGIVTLGHTHPDEATSTEFSPGDYQGPPNVDSVFFSYNLENGAALGALPFGSIPNIDQVSQFEFVRHDCGDLVYGRFSGTADWLGEDLIGDEGTFRGFIAFEPTPLEIPSF